MMMNSFDTDREELLKNMEAGGIGLIVNVGSTIESWDKIMGLDRAVSFCVWRDRRAPG